MPLTNPAVKQALPKTKDYWLSDSKGLRLLVKKNGSKYWRLKYRHGGKQKTLALGVYPEVTLKQAREGRDEARQLLRNGYDPIQIIQQKKKRQTENEANSFEGLALDWFEKEKSSWSASHTKKQKWILETNLLPYIGNSPVNSIDPPKLLAALRRTESRGAIETARRTRQVAGQIFRYGVAIGRAERDPSADLKGALKTPKVRHFPSITDPSKVGPLLRALEDYDGSFVVKTALLLSPMFFVRPGELRHMEWSEIHWKESEWRISADKMKMGQSHIVPIPDQAVTLLKELELLTGKWQYVFPSERSRHRPMSENTLNAALRRLGYSKDEMTAHGFRATARTLLDEELGFPPHLIEHQLAHDVRDPLGRAYNRTTHLPQRKKMMQKWADYLDQLKQQAMSSNVISASFKQR